MEVIDGYLSVALIPVGVLALWFLKRANKENRYDLVENHEVRFDFQQQNNTSEALLIATHSSARNSSVSVGIESQC